MKLVSRPVIDDIMSSFIEILRLAAPEGLEVAAITLRVFDSEYNNLVLFGKTGLKHPEKRRMVVPLEGTVSGHLYREGGRKFISVQNKEWFNDQDRQLAHQEGYQYMMAAELAHLGRRIGTVQVYISNHFESFDQEALDKMMSYLQDISSKFVISYFEDELLIKIQEELSGTNPRGSFYHICAIIAELFNSQGVIIYYRSGKDEVKLISGFAGRNIPEHGIGQRFKISKNGDPNLEYLNEVMTKKETQIFQASDERLKTINEIMYFQHTESIMIAPITVDSFVQGFIVVNQSNNRPSFDEKEIKLIDRIALKISQSLNLIRKQKENAACQAANVSSSILAEIRHNLLNPLLPLVSYANSLLNSDVLPEELRKYAEGILQEAKNLDKRLRDLENLYCNDNRIAMSWVNLVSLLENKIESWRDLCKERELTLVFDKRVKKVCRNANNQLLEIALENLFNNAIEATEQKDGWIEIAIRKSNRHNPVITITNPGEIPVNKLSKIFHSGYSTKKTGSGQGLTIAKKYVAMHGGEIACESNNGKTSFRIVLLGNHKKIEEEE